MIVSQGLFGGEKEENGPWFAGWPVLMVGDRLFLSWLSFVSNRMIEGPIVTIAEWPIIAMLNLGVVTNILSW